MAKLLLALLEYAFLVLLGTALGLIGAESFARLVQHAPVFSLHNIWPGFQDLARTHWFVPDAHLGYVPGVQWQAQGRFGFQNGTEYQDPANPTAANVVILGDSVIQDSRFSDALRALTDPQRVYLWKAGIGGYSTPQEVEYLRTRTSLPRTDVILLGFCLNDFFPALVVLSGENAAPMRASKIDPVRVRFPSFFLASSVYQRLLLWENMLPEEDFSWSVRMVARNSRRVHEALMALKEYAATRSAGLVVMVFPYLRSYSGQDGLAEYLRAAHGEILQLVSKEKIRYVDFHDSIREGERENFRVSAEDEIHPNRAAHTLFARDLAARFPEYFPGH
jgi:lysophospholipase L1-like esterase